MGRVSTCQKICKTIDLRGAPVNKMAVVAVNLAAIPDSLATFLVVNSETLVWRYQLFAQSKRKYLVINKKVITVRSECILACRSLRTQTSVSSARGRLAPPMNAESDIVREKMHGKQTGTRLGTGPPAYYDVTGIHRHIPPGHANKCSH